MSYGTDTRDAIQHIASHGPAQRRLALIARDTAGPDAVRLTAAPVVLTRRPPARQLTPKEMIVAGAILILIGALVAGEEGK